MSGFALGNNARVGTLFADNLDIPFNNTGQMIGKTYEFADTGATVPPRGFHTVDATAGDVTLTLADGQNNGDVVEFLYAHSNSNDFILNFKLRGTPHTATCATTSGQYFKLAWLTATNGTVSNGWVCIGRTSSELVAAGAVAGLVAFA